MVAILNFKMNSLNQEPNVIVMGLVEFLDPANIGLDIKTMSLWLTQAEIWSKVIFMAAILKSAFFTKIYKDLGETSKFFFNALGMLNNKIKGDFVQ